MRICENGKSRELTEAELAEFQKQAEIQRAHEESRPLTTEEVSRMVIANQINNLTVDNKTALRMVNYYPKWAENSYYAIGYKVQHGGILYRCLTEHTSQDTWTPPDSPSLWARVLISEDGEILPWEQPDSTNPYRKGDKVTHNGKTWVSDVDGNVWEPGVYGWTEVST